MFSGGLNDTEGKGFWQMISFHSTDFLGVSQEPPQALLPTCLVDLWCSQSLSPDWSGQMGQRQPAGRRNKDPGLRYLGNGQYFSPISTLSDPPLQRWGGSLQPTFLLCPVTLGLAASHSCGHHPCRQDHPPSQSAY